MDQVDEIVQEFLVESYDSLDQLDADFVALEESPSDRDRLSSIFRTVHTIKGTSGFLDFPKMEHVAHVGENLLVPLRDGELTLTNNIADALLGMVDAIREMLKSVEATGGEGGREYDELITKLEAARSASPEEKGAPVGPATLPPIAPIETDPLNSTANTTPSVDPVPAAQANTTNTDQASATPVDASEKESSSEPRQLPKPALPTGAKPKEHSLADSTVRIHVELLDKLMNLVGELVLARNQVLQYSEDATDAAISTASQRLNLITTELQEGVMKTRMQPIRNAWSKLPRVVRDLSASCGKNVRVEMEGADTELDKTILEAIKDPLTHIVRNSVDHGIESPEERAKAGKPEIGTLWLRAFHEGGQVNIEIIDDGAGINLERVRAKAIEKGLITVERSESMNERELTNLVLLPGFSTAQKVTNVSGRGVGMDVVRTNIEKINGSLEIQSRPGKGTTLRIKIPLTLAIVPALVVTAHGERYAIPQINLLELVRLEGNRVDSDIEMIHDVPVYRLRGKLLPLLYLHEQLELPPVERLGTDELASCGESESQKDEDEDEDEDEKCVNIVVLQAEDCPFGLVVDSISDTQEIVVKPLGQLLSDVSAFAGATIMGDGAVALILDVIGLAKRGNIVMRQHDHVPNEEQSTIDVVGEPVKSMLVVDRGDGTRAAIDLASVARLEEIPFDKIEYAGGHAVVQYRDGILPLVPLTPNTDLASLANQVGTEETKTNRVQVVVSNGSAGRVGVVVGKIIDVVEHSWKQSSPPSGSRPASMPDLQVIQDKVTTIVDLETVICGTKLPYQSCED